MLIVIIVLIIRLSNIILEFDRLFKLFSSKWFN